MDIKELDKKQLILVTLLITFVVSIATGIITVSLMQQMPESVPQTINNVIQRTIEKVTTVQVQVPAKDDTKNDIKNIDEKKEVMFLGSGDVMVSIYSNDEVVIPADPIDTSIDAPIVAVDNVDGVIEADPVIKEPKPLGQGIIISDVGLILVESSILDGYHSFKVNLNEIDFDISILKKFKNGFTVLKIISKEEKEKIDKDNADSIVEDTLIENIDNQEPTL